ncbi:MAG TPA: hypothetical protein VHC69_07460 [Polyangiaceae bacterium]|nr:hypothetical protein [Polyangiaceae bacterium]
MISSESEGTRARSATGEATDAPSSARVSKRTNLSRIKRILNRPGAWVAGTYGALAVVLGLPSLLYPLGRDQGLFYYAAREWLLRGQVLYRDVWDHKPPVIYFVYMTAIGLFGEHTWAIRVLELLVAVPLLGWCAARLVSEPGEPGGAERFAVAWFGVALSYYGCFNFWDTAQCEIWSVLFAMLALVAVLRARRAPVGAFAGGVLCAIALFTKPPVIFFVLLCAGAVAWRARRDGAAARIAVRRLGEWALGIAVTAAAVLAYFAIRGALAPMIDILVGANAVYVASERTVDSTADMFTATTGRFASMEPLSAAAAVVVAGALFIGFARRDRTFARRYALPLLLALATYAGVVMQLKFYDYHWGTIVAAGGVLAVTLYQDAQRISATRNGLLAPAAYLAAVAGLCAISGAPAVQSWLKTSQNTVGLLTGSVSRGEFMRAFDIPNFYACYEADLTGRWLADHASKDDTLVVRGFEPEIYAKSGLHFTGRFFWTSFLTMPTRSYRRAELLDEDLQAIVKHPPRFAVALSAASDGLDSAAWFERLGYVRRVETGTFTVLERGQ